MKNRLFAAISAMATVGILIFAGVRVLGFEPTAQTESGGTLEGTWLNEVKIVTCPPAPYAVIATFQSMTTYMRGTLVEGGSPPAPFPSRSAGQGIWERASGHGFLVFFRSHSFDNLGRRVRVTEVTSHPDLIKGDNPETPDFEEPYYLSGDGTNKVTNFNPVDGTVISVTEGCNQATSRPFLFEG